MDGELAEAGTGRQTLRQFELEVLKTGATNRPTEPYDRRLADADAMGQLSHGAVHDRSRIKQNMVGDLEFRFAE